MKWKCLNCGELFKSESNEEFEIETTEHLSYCLQHDEFIEVIGDE